MVASLVHVLWNSCLIALLSLNGRVLCNFYTWCFCCICTPCLHLMHIHYTVEHQCADGVGRLLRSSTTFSRYPHFSGAWLRCRGCHFKHLWYGRTGSGFEPRLLGLAVGALTNWPVNLGSICRDKHTRITRELNLWIFQISLVTPSSL